MAEYGLPDLRRKLEDLGSRISGTEAFEASLYDLLAGMFFTLEDLTKKYYEPKEQK